MPDKRKKSKTPNEWIDLAAKDKDCWNENIDGWAVGSDFIDFRGAEIHSGVVDFSGFVFPVDVDFSGAGFVAEARFKGAEFQGSADFRDATFVDSADFSDAKFQGVADFCNAKFNSDSSFRNVFFNEDAQFRGAKFNTEANFDHALFNGFAVFHGAKFSGAAYFGEAIFRWAPWFKGEDMHGNIRFDPVSDFDTQFLDRGEDVRGRRGKSHTIANYRELKLAMKRIESHAEENAFFRLEMLARKHREPWYKKGLYWPYELASDYGQSIARPIILLVVFFFVFFGLYWGFPQLLGDGNKPCDHIRNALQLAMEKAFVFPGMFSGTRMELSGLGTLLAGVHWLLSAASWFLMLLGLRNRFRLK